MKNVAVRQVRGILGLLVGTGAVVALLYVADLLSPLGGATGYIAGPIATLFGAAIGGLIGGVAAGGAIMFAVASAGVAMAGVWFLFGKAAVLFTCGATLLVTGLAVFALFSEALSVGGGSDGDEAAGYEGAVTCGFIAAALAGVGTLIAEGAMPALASGAAAGVVSGAVVGWVTATLHDL